MKENTAFIADVKQGEQASPAQRTRIPRWLSHMGLKTTLGVRVTGYMIMSSYSSY